MILKTKLVYHKKDKNIIFLRTKNKNGIKGTRAIDGCIGCANYNYQSERGCFLKKRLNIDITLLKCGFDIYYHTESSSGWWDDNNWDPNYIHYRYVAEKGLDD